MTATRRLIQRVSLVVLASALMAAAACTQPAEEDSLPRRVFVFGMDGATWRVLDPMMKSGELPTLARLYKTGVHGVLQSRTPIISPVVWSTIFTGRLHTDHGVVNWKTSQSQHRRVKTIWEIASGRERTSNVFNVPSTWPPRPLRGAMISGFPLGGATVGGAGGVVVTRDFKSRQRVHAVFHHNKAAIGEAMDALAVGEWGPWLTARVKNRRDWRCRLRVRRLAEDSYYVSPCYRSDAGFVSSYPPELRDQVVEGLGGAPYVAEGPGWARHAEPETPVYLAEHLTQVSRIQTRAVTQFAGRPWDLLVYVHTLIDRISHPYWAYMHARHYQGLSEEKAERYSEVVGDAYREVDAQLAALLGAIEGEAYVVIVSDHGFKSSLARDVHIGTHDSHGIYLISGPGLMAGQGAYARIEDVGPTVLYLLGLPVAEDMSGRVLPEVSRFVGREIERVATYETGERHEVSDIPVDEDTWEQLRALGYVDGAAPRGESGE